MPVPQALQARAGESAPTIRSRASAPISRASQTSAGLTVKSLRRTGSSTAERASARSSAEPPKNSWSVRTDRQAAPAPAYDLARTPATRSGAKGPLEGLRRFISAMTAGPPLRRRAPLRKAAAKPRAGGHFCCLRHQHRDVTVVSASRLAMPSKDLVEVRGHPANQRSPTLSRPRP